MSAVTTAVTAATAATGSGGTGDCAPAASNYPDPAKNIRLTDEQQRLLDEVAAGHDVIVDSTVGSGKTASIQAMCAIESKKGRSILYLTYSRMLKADAQDRVGGAKVQNYHGVVYPHLLRMGLDVGISESVQTFNAHFADIAPGFEHYDLLVIDEYQDINTEYSRLILHIKSTNPDMQVVMVGDLEQKVRSDTTLDAGAFALELCTDPVLLGFTRSFRMGPVMGQKLATAWNKPVIGVNEEQKVEVLSHGEAIELIAATEPGDLLCLGKRTGAMTHALNEVEKLAPTRYNKDTVFASIRDGGSDIRPADGVAVFTTFDASKGMERPVCVVFDYGQENWKNRGSFPGADHEVLRNIFLVAASRGKYHIVFVRSGAMRASAPSPTTPAIGDLPLKLLTELPQSMRPQYQSAFQASGCFDFTYAENVATAMSLLERERLAPAGREIQIKRNDGLIDLSPAVGEYQEACFFTGYDATAQAMMLMQGSPMAGSFVADLGKGNLWRDCLVLTAMATEQRRYLDQVGIAPSEHSTAELMGRLEQVLPREAQCQIPMSLSGTAFTGKGTGQFSPIEFVGIADALHRGVIHELKFTSALDHPMFLQVALYVVMARRLGREVSHGELFNTRTGEHWLVRVPDDDAFLDAVVRCVTKQSYSYFRG